MPSDKPTRQPGTPVGELLARRSSQPASTKSRPQPAKRPCLPIDILCSDSDSDAAYIETPPSPKPEEKPKPSAAPHLRLAASASKPSEESLRPPKAEFGCQINFDFCRHAVQNSASNCLKPGSQPTVLSAGFAQVWGHDIRFFPSDDDASPAASSESLSSSLSSICTLRAYLPLPAPGRYYALTTMSGSKSSYAIRFNIASYQAPVQRSACTVTHLFCLLRMPTGSASSQLSQWQRLNAGLSGPLAFEHDFSALDDPASSHDAAFASEPYDFHEDGTPPAQPIDLHLLLSRFRLASNPAYAGPEALRAWLNLLPPEERRAAQSAMGATLPASAQASHEPTHVAAPDEPTPTPSQADPSTTPIPEEPNPILLAQREWYDSQDKIFQGPIRPEPWQDDDLSAQPSSSASPQPTVNETSTAPQAPDQEPWLLPKPDTCLFNIFGESFELQARKEKIAKGQMPHCLFKDPAAVDQQPLNRQEMWAAMQYKPIYRTAGRWTYWDLLPDDIRKPPPPFCTEIEDAPKQPPASRLQPNKRDSRYQLTVPARPRMTSRADPATVYMPQPGQDLDIDQPGAFTQPYLFDISLLDRRAQPLYGHPHYKPIECMVFDKRPWICFYGGSPPTVVAETDEWWYTMYDREGGCCLQGWPMFLLQDFMRLFADPPPSPEPTHGGY
ncbi:unnamed protein product [Symbiodinium microadriaticum]|nr:unnamed protein product [Symbiodinium microadriaticum]